MTTLGVVEIENKLMSSTNIRLYARQTVVFESTFSILQTLNWHWSSVYNACPQGGAKTLSW